MLEKFREPTKPYVEKIAKLFSWMNPNLITIIGFLLSLIAVYLFINGKPRLAGVALILTFFDSIDGAVARYTGKVSLFGEVLDASFDRITDGLIILGIAWGGYINWIFAFFVLIGFYMVSYIRARTGEASSKKVKLNVGTAERGDRIIILVLASLFYFECIKLPIINLSVNTLEIAFALLAVLTWQTTVLRLLRANKELKKLT